ncbi:DNA-binding transcriptional MerR regulator [Breznakia blatticola]|uniref:DNA-binding transcriptional MerR regulator n=1 Tax=Breznakia blatticola TaxID=1754012 RepID=A0A4R7ZAX7_9FIRM|nr:MerR family transcriptional regulator [Breznakia blatticola]TDW13239.1 DNA-binding transcriptional MerR regulator [Breznakia blatticola]
MKTYKTNELAKQFQIHANTVRLYEGQHFISKAKRLKNGYRQFDEIHFWQLFICRKIFEFPYSNSRIRKSGIDIIYASGSQKVELLDEKLAVYRSIILEELQKAQRANQLLLDWLNDQTIEEETHYYTRKEIASILDTTKETVRNWERNDLVQTTLLEDPQQRYFNEEALKRCRIIYLLRQVGFSMHAIYQCLHALDTNDASLNLSKEEAFSAGDRWLIELNSLFNSIPSLEEAVDKLKTLHLLTNL